MSDTLPQHQPDRVLVFAVHPDDETLGAGGLIQKAYNPGGTTLRFDTGKPETFGAESLWNYELFIRASPVRRRERRLDHPGKCAGSTRRGRAG